MFDRFVLKGIYPTHPLWEWLPMILIFEVAVVLIEFFIAWILYGLIEKREGEFKATYLLLIIGITNLVSFLVGLTLQIAFTWSL